MRYALSIAILSLALAACGDDAAAPIGMIDGALSDAESTEVSGTDADTVVEVDILYTGYPCAEDNACSTGLCYGKATAQGFFEPAQCQARCLEPFDFDHYCDSDLDCCHGHCCLDCGPKTGLCTLD